jgi:hypothetical protein
LVVGVGDLEHGESKDIRRHFSVKGLDSLKLLRIGGCNMFVYRGGSHSNGNDQGYGDNGKVGGSMSRSARRGRKTGIGWLVRLVGRRVSR